MAKFFNKKKLIILLAGAAMCVSTAFAVGCGEAKIDRIQLTAKNMPQTTYVLGNDLNLADGKLTVVIEGKQSEVALDDPAVTVTGYDKDQLGKQSLTVEYKGKTTVFSVNVVPRVSVAKYETAYFVGEPFNAEKGDIIITADNGESTLVSMNDKSITVSGFDSTTENEALPITITYQTEDVTYSTNVEIGIYEVEEIEFKAPNIKAYKSHDKELNVVGGYMALKAGDFTRYVILTATWLADLTFPQRALNTAKKA